MTHLDAINATAHLPLIERQLDDRRREATTSAWLREIRPLRRAARARARRQHGDG
jgi:hypothetical protein